MSQSTDNNNNQETLLDGENAVYLEQLFEKFLEDPNSVSERWQRYFVEMPVPADFVTGNTHSEMREKFAKNNLLYLCASIHFGGTTCCMDYPIEVQGCAIGLDLGRNCLWARKLHPSPNGFCIFYVRR